MTNTKTLPTCEMGIPCDTRDDRVKVGRRYQRQTRYTLAKRLESLGFTAHSNNTDSLQVGDEIIVTRVPSPIHASSLGRWEIVSFFGATAQVVRVAS